MPTPASSTFEAITRKVWLEKKIFDQTLGHIPVFGVFYNKRRPWRGGNYGAIVVQVESPQSSVFIRGYDPIPHQQHDTKRDLVVQISQMRNGIIFSHEDIFRTAEEALAGVIEEQLTTVGLSMRDEVENLLFTGSAAAGQIPGLREAVDDGTVAATYLGLSRTLYPVWRANVTTAATTLSYSALASLRGQCLQGQYDTDWAVTTLALRNAYAALVAPQFRIMLPVDYADYGPREGLLFEGIPVTHSDKCQANHWYFLNTNVFDMYVDKACDFTFSRPEKLPGQDVWQITIRFNWTLVCRRPRANGKFTNLTP